jgi:DNA-binding transcriptional MerR regulator
MAEYLKRDIARILKKSPRTIEFWTSSGLVIPDIEPSQGKGKPRVFSGRNLLEFVMIDMLARMGVSLEVIKEILGVLRKGEWINKSIANSIAKSSGLSDEEKEQKKRQNTQVFKDFWISEAWGFSRELVYVCEKQILSNVPELVHSFVRWHVFEMKPDAPSYEFNTPIEKDLLGMPGFVQTVIWLGYIKNEAASIILS